MNSECIAPRVRVHGRKSTTDTFESSHGYVLIGNGANNPLNVIHVNSASVSPNSPQIPGDITVNVNLDILQDVNGPLTAHLEIKRELAFGISVTIPCVSDFGSW